MGVSLNQRASVPPDVLLSEVGGEMVVLNLKTEQYFGLDATGTRMWQVLTSAPSLQAAYEALLTEYEVEEQVLLEDLLKLVESLTEQGLLELGEP